MNDADRPLAPALDGLRVLDCSTGTAGPLAAMLLGDHGADVVKIEPPGGDPARTSPAWPVWNRGKRSVVVDAGTVAGRAELDALVDREDVCIVGGSSSSLAGGPLEPAALAVRNPRLVVAHLPPYLDEAPWPGDLESQPLLHAINGLAMNQSSSTAAPVDCVAEFVLVIHGLWTAACTVAALLERNRSGAGQVVTVSAMHGMAVTACSWLTLDTTAPGRSRPTVGGPGGAMPYYRLYRCADDQWLFLAALSEAFTRDAFAILGVSDILTDARLGDRGRPALLDEANAPWAIERVAAAFAERTADEWVTLLSPVCAVAIAAPREAWMDHPQLRAIGMRVEVDDPDRGPLVMPGVPLVLSATPAAVAGPAPAVGSTAATTVWTADATAATAPQTTGAARTTTPQTAAGAGPLAGVRVLDLGTVLAGPMAGMLLAELGADVIKVEPLAGDSYRGAGFAQYNKGQRGLAIDLRDDAGRGAFLRLAATSDVVVDNYRPGVVSRLGIAFDDLREVNPGIVSASITGFGDSGPLGEAPGFDPILQTMSGMVSAQGGDHDPVMTSVPSNDVAGAAATAFGVLVALLARDRDGTGQRVSTSLAAMATTIQAADLVRFDGRPAAHVGGVDHPGPSPSRRMYATADGWICIDTEATPGTIVAALSGSDDPRSSNDAGSNGAGTDDVRSSDHAGLDDVLAATTSADALARLAQASVAAVPVRTLHEVVADPDLRAAGIIRPYPADGFPTMVTTGEHARFGRSTPEPTAAAPRLGEHSVAVLEAAGLRPDEIADLVARGVIVQAEALPGGATTLW